MIHCGHGNVDVKLTEWSKQNKHGTIGEGNTSQMLKGRFVKYEKKTKYHIKVYVIVVCQAGYA